MPIAQISEVASLSEVAQSSINTSYLTAADNYVELILNRTFDEDISKEAVQYEDLVNLNDYVTDYDGSLKFVLGNQPVMSLDEVVYLPDYDDPETLVDGEDYVVDLNNGVVSILQGFSPIKGKRVLKFTYTYGFIIVPKAVRSFTNLYAAFLVESKLPKNSEGVVLTEVEIGRYREKYTSANATMRAKYSNLNKMEALLVEKYKLWE